MPRRKATKRKRPNMSRNRRPTKRRRFNRPFPGGQQVLSLNSTSLTPVGSASVPQSMNVKLRYFDSHYLGATNASLYNYSGNSLYDPLWDTGGHQPMGFDQWSAFYNQYRVNGVKIKATLLMNSTGQHAIIDMPTMQIAVFPNYDQGAAVIGKGILMEMPQRSIAYATGIGGQSIASAEMYIPIHTFFGLTQAEYKGDPQYQAPYNQDPASQAVIGVQTQGVGLAGRIADCEIYIEVTYYATMFDPKQLAQS